MWVSGEVYEPLHNSPPSGSSDSGIRSELFLEEATQAASSRNWKIMSPREAPTDLLTPISLRLSDTAIDIRDMPIPPMRSDMTI